MRDSPDDQSNLPKPSCTLEVTNAQGSISFSRVTFIWDPIPSLGRLCGIGLGGDISLGLLIFLGRAMGLIYRSEPRQVPYVGFMSRSSNKEPHSSRLT